jgi:NADPH-dependent curcumin reductase CurA
VGWQEYQVISSADGPIGYPPPSALVRAANGSNAPMNYVFRPELTESWSPEVLMDVFSTSGMTAFFGMRECGPIMPRDRVLVAGASGSVGSIAAQLAKARGAYVVGLAGGPQRCNWVIDKLGLDDCLDYRAEDLEHQLRRAFPEGIDVFSDGVGGGLTERVLSLMNRDGRLFAYGSSASSYAKDKSRAPITSLRQAFGVTADIEALARAKNIKIECWIVYDFYHERVAAENEMSRLLWAGALKPLVNVTEGFENLPQAVIGMYENPRAGKAQVRFEPAPLPAAPGGER